MIPLHSPILNIKDLISIPDKNYITELKDYFYHLTDKEHSIFTGDGRTAIYLALKFSGLNQNDEILVPGYICDAVKEAIKPNCRPIFVDIDKTFNIDAEKIISKKTDRTKAILISHLYGNPSDMDILVDFAKENNLIIIEDVAQALMGEYDNKALGSFGDFAIFSFRFTKDVTCFRGGALLMNERFTHRSNYGSNLNAPLKLLITLSAFDLIRLAPSAIYSPLKKNVIFPFFKKSASKFAIDDKKITNYQCYLIIQQLKKLDAIINIRRSNSKYYFKELKNIVPLPNETKKGRHTFYRFTIQSNNRDKLCDYLLKHNIEADKMYDYYQALLPQSVTASKVNLTIPVHQNLTKKDLENIVGAIHEFERVGKNS